MNEEAEKNRKRVEIANALAALADAVKRQTGNLDISGPGVTIGRGQKG